MQRRHLLKLVAPALAALAPPARAQGSSADAMYEALRTQPKQRRTMDGGALDVVFDAGVPAGQREAILRWIDLAAAALTRYFARFPVRHAGVLVESMAGARIAHGVSYGHEGSAIRIGVGREAGPAAFERDWVLVHEMVHLAFPSMARRHLWLQEGGATYVEPIARAQAGQIAVAAVWKDLLRGLPQGLPQAGDEGLDRTPTWGRTYWGGALFCLEADLELLRRTEGRRGLQDALRAIAADSGGNATRWSIEQVLQSAERAVGVPVLAEFYAARKDRPVSTDLEALFGRLGVAVRGDDVVFDDAAPWAALRRSITAR